MKQGMSINEVVSKMRESNLLDFFFLLLLSLISSLLFPFVRLWYLRLRPTSPALLLRSWPFAAAADCFAVARQGRGFAGTLTTGSSPVHSSSSDDGDDSLSEGASFSDGDECASRAKGDFCF